MFEPRKILIIQLKRAGDVIVTTPIAAILKRRWPQARVDFLVDPGFASLLENNPSIDGVQKYDKKSVVGTLQRIRAERYDLILDFQSSPRSAIVALTSGAASTAGYRVPFWGRAYKQTVQRPGGGLSVVQGKVTLVEAVAGPVPNIPERQIFLTPAEKAWSQTALKVPAGKKTIGLIPTHRHSSRRWHADSFAELARLLHGANHEVWLFWGPGEKDYVETVAAKAPHAHVMPPTSFRQMAALMARCDLIVSNDNGPMHMATAVGVPTVTIYGPTDPLAWNPGGPRHRTVQAADLRCIGCNLNRCPFNHECMTWISASRVFEISQAALTQLLKGALI